MKQLNKLRMKRFYLTLCFLMSVIGSAWGQETFTVTSDTQAGAVTPGEFVSLVGSDGKVAFQFGASDITWKTGYYTIDGEKKYYYARNSGDNAQTSGSNIPTGGYYYAFKATANGTINIGMAIKPGTSERTVSIYSSDNSTIYDVDGNSISSSTKYKGEESGSIYEFEYNIKVTAGITYYIYTTGTGNLWFRSYTFTPYDIKSSTANVVLSIGEEPLKVNNTCIYKYTGGNQEFADEYQLINYFYPSSGFAFDVTPSETGFYTISSIMSTDRDGRIVTLTCTEVGGSEVGSIDYNLANNGFWDRTQNGANAPTYSSAFNLEKGKTYTITVTGAKSTSDVVANIYDMTIEMVHVHELNIADLNYVYNTNANRGFDRLGIQGFDITFAGGDGVKCYTDNGNQIFIRNRKKDAESTGDQGQMTIALHDAAGENNGKYISSIEFTASTFLENGIGVSSGTIDYNKKVWTANENVQSVTFTAAAPNSTAIDFSGLTITTTDALVGSNWENTAENSNGLTPVINIESDDVIIAGTNNAVTKTITMSSMKDGNTIQEQLTSFDLKYTISKDDVDITEEFTVAVDVKQNKTTTVTFTPKNTWVKGEYVVTASYDGKRKNTNGQTLNSIYQVAESKSSIKVNAATANWDFTTWTDSDKAILDGDAWDEYGDSEPNRYTNNNKLDNSEIGFSMTGGLTFSTSGADQMSVYYSADGDGSIRVHNASTKITIPDLFAGQVLKFTTQSTGSEARGLVPVEGTEGLELISAADKGTGVFVSMYRVKANGTYSFCSSHNGLHIYKIELQEVKEDPNLSFAKDVLVADIATGNIYAYNNDGVTVNTNDLFDESGNLQNPNSLNVTYQSSDETVVTVDESGNVTFAPTATAGKEVKIFAIYEGDENYSLKSISYTLRLKVKTSISYAETTKSVPLNVGFVEPQPIIKPAGVNIVEYTSSNTTAANIMSNTGEVTLLAAGETVITASIPDNEYYMGASASYILTVAAAAHTGSFNYKINGVGTQYDKVSGEASRWSGHKFEIDQTNSNTEQSVISGINFTCLPAVEITLGAYDGTSQWTISTGARDTSGKLYAALKDANGNKINVELPTDAEGNITSLLPTGGTYIALEPVMSGILAIEAEYFGDQNVVIVDKQTGEIVDSYHPGHNINNYGNHEFSKILEAGKTYYVYNIGNNKKGDEYQNWGFNFKSISFSPVFVDKLTKVTPSTNVFAITGDAMAKGISVIPTIASERHDHDEITYTTTQENVIYMNENGVFTLGDGLIDINNANTIEATLTATSTAVDVTNKHTSVATCVVQYTKSSLKFTPASITVPVNQGTGIEIDEPKFSYTGSDVAYSSSDASNFSVDETTGEVTLAKENATGATITAALTGEGRMYYVTPATYQIIAAAQASPLKVINKEVELVVGTAGYSLLGNNDIGIDDNGKKKIFWVNNDKKEYYEDADESNKGLRFFEDRFTIKDANILSINKYLKVDAKSVGTTTVTVTTKPIKEGDNVLYEPTELTITVHVVERTFNPEEATLRVWDFTKGMDTNALKTMAESYSNYWTYDAEKGVAKTNVVGQVKGEEYVCEMTDGFNETKKVFEEQGFGLADFVTTSAETEVAANSLLLTTFNRSNMETHNGNVENGENKEATTATDITLNALSTIGEVPGITKIPGQDLVEDPDEIEYKNNYRGIELHGHASFIVVDGIKDGVTVSIVADNVNATDIVEGNYMQLASNLGNQPLQGIFPNKFEDAKDPKNNKYYYNRLTNVFIYKPATDTEGNTVTKAGFETTGVGINVTNLLMGYPAASGMLNEGDKTTTSKNGSTVKRTEGYATFVSPYNIDMTGQKVLKAYICDYYGEGNKQVHMKQVRNIPANTPVLLKGYARDMYVLYVSEGNKAVELGYDENNDALLAANKLVGLTEARDIQMTETEVSADGSQTTYYNFGLSGNKWAKFSSTGTGVAGKAYLRLTEEEFADLMASSISTSSSSARATFVFEDLPEDDTTGSTTGIEVIETQNSNNYDGGDYYYGINGLRIGKDKPTAKGLYIYKGKKIIIK